MLKKLLKQEWKGFSLAPAAAMIILAVLTVILMSTFMTSFWEQSSNVFIELFAGLIILAYIFCLAAVSFCITICTAVRFYKNLFTDEGYLMFTLPVKTSDLLLSKILVAALWRAISFVCIFFSIFGVASVAGAYISDTGIVQFFREFLSLFGDLFDMTWFELPAPLFFIWLILLCICSLFFNILYIHTCICMGQLFRKHKIGGAIISYFVLRFVFRLFRQILAIPLSNVFTYYDLENVSSVTWLLTMFISLLVMGGLCAVMYFFCIYQMSRKLNLD